MPTGKKKYKPKPGTSGQTNPTSTPASNQLGQASCNTVLTQLGVAPQPSSYKSTDTKLLWRLKGLSTRPTVVWFLRGSTYHCPYSQPPARAQAIASTTKTQSCYCLSNPFGLLETQKTIQKPPFPSIQTHIWPWVKVHSLVVKVTELKRGPYPHLRNAFMFPSSFSSTILHSGKLISW